MVSLLSTLTTRRFPVAEGDFGDAASHPMKNPQQSATFPQTLPVTETDLVPSEDAELKPAFLKPLVMCLRFEQHRTL